MTSQTKLWALSAGALALSLALAGCGGGGSSSSGISGTSVSRPAPTTPTTAEPTALETANDLAGRFDDTDVDQLLKDANKYAGMLTTSAVDGDSAMAMANAQKVLDANIEVMYALTAAEEALDEIEAAMTAAEAIENEAEKAAALRLLEDAQKAAEEVMKAAQDAIDGTGAGSLAAAVAMVTGGPNADPQMTTADAAEDVAAEVRTALASAAVTQGNSANATKGAIQNDSAHINAMTWAMIAGEGNVMDVRRFADSAISEVKAMSVMGSVAAGLAATGVTIPDDQDDTKDGIQNDDGAMYDAMYKGIDGTVFCAGTDCGQSADGKLTGSWYFTPDSTTELFVPGAGGVYKIADMYARYGAWLTYASAGDATPNGVATYAAVGKDGTTNTASLNLIRPTSATSDVTAEYAGKAAGISVWNKASGRFTADVNLTAKFGEAIANSSLRGRIHGFDGAGANPDWIVTLSETGLTDAAALTANGVASGGGTPGAWTAQGYGPGPVDHDNDPDTTARNQRPEGFFGRFNANFGDGSAAGGYATRK